MLDNDELASLAVKLWRLHDDERFRLDMIHEYRVGARTGLILPEDASDEIKELASISRENVLGLVVESFTQNLSVIGFRPTSAVDNAPAWNMWQRNRMDARQGEVHGAAVEYGVSYVAATPSEDGPVFRPRSPRRMVAVYEDPQLDEWPQYAMETWVSHTDGDPVRRGMFYDDEFVYPVSLGPVSVPIRNDVGEHLVMRIVDFGEAVPHGAGVCPVVRFVNERDSEGCPVGEITDDLIVLQKAINTAVFDRKIVSRFGAHPQKVISGWSGTKQEVLAASARRVWTFEEPDVKAQSFAPAALDPYTNVIEDMKEHVAMVAQISPSQVTGKMVNVSADALAAAEANQQRKLGAKRDSLGEAHEQLLRLGARMSGDVLAAEDVEAEVVWRDTEARSFAAVVDGVTKLSSQGVPVEELLELVPGMTQQRIRTIRDKIKANRVRDMVSGLSEAAAKARAEQSQAAALAARNVAAV